MVGEDEIKVDHRKIDMVTRRTRPIDVSQLHSFLGLNNYFYQFIQGYSILVTLLYHLTNVKSFRLINVKSLLKGLSMC